MTRAIIVDDEQHCIDRLSGLLAQHYNQSIQVLKTVTSGEDAKQAIRQLQPDLVFLDVQLGEISAFDLLKELGVIHFDVIFTTAFEKYAVQAFKFSAIDYLLKPVADDDLRQALEKLAAKKSKDEISRKFEVLFHNLNNWANPSRKISIPTVNGFTFLQISDIIRCQSEVNYTTLFLKDKQKLTVAKTLKEFEELLSDYNFYRVHNSHLINLACIKSYNRGKGGFVSMIDNSQVEVSTRRKDEFLRKISEI